MPFPIIVSPSSYQISSGTVGNPNENAQSGPFVKNATTRYLTMYGSNSIILDTTLGVLKTIDNGVTWIPHDEANAPLFHNTDFVYSSCFDGVSKIWIIYIDDANELTAISFDITTDTWGSPVSQGGVISPGDNVIALTTCWRSDGKVAIVIHDGTFVAIGAKNCYICVFKTFNPTGSIWSTSTNLSNVNLGTGFNETNLPLQIVEGDSQIIHCLMWQGGPTSGTIPDPLLFQSIDNTNTLSSLLTLATDPPFNTDGHPTATLNYQPSTNRLVIAYALYWDGTTYQQNDVQYLGGPSTLNVALGSLGNSTFAPNTISTLSLANNGATVNSFVSVSSDSGVVQFFFGPIAGPFTLIGISSSSIWEYFGSILFSTTTTNYGLAWRNFYWEVSTTPVITCPCYLLCPGGQALAIYCSPCDPPLICCSCKTP